MDLPVDQQATHRILNGSQNLEHLFVEENFGRQTNDVNSSDFTRTNAEIESRSSRCSNYGGWSVPEKLGEPLNP